MSTSYTLQFPRHNQDKIIKVKDPVERSNQDHTRNCATPSNQCFHQVRASYAVTVSEIQPKEIFPGAMSENKTCIAFKGSQVQMVHFLLKCVINQLILYHLQMDIYKIENLIPYPMDNCFTGRRDRSRQTSEKDVLYILPAGPVTECAFPRWRIVLHFLFTS